MPKLDEVEAPEAMVKDFLSNEAPMDAMWKQLNHTLPPPELVKVVKAKGKCKWISARWGYKTIQDKVTRHFY